MKRQRVHFRFVHRLKAAWVEEEGAPCKQHIFWLTSANVTRRLYLEFRMRPSTTLFSIPFQPCIELPRVQTGEERSSRREDREDRDAHVRDDKICKSLAGSTPIPTPPPPWSRPCFDRWIFKQGSCYIHVCSFTFQKDWFCPSFEKLIIHNFGMYSTIVNDELEPNPTWPNLIFLRRLLFIVWRLTENLDIYGEGGGKR